MNSLVDLQSSGHDLQGKMERNAENPENIAGDHGGVCAICLDKIQLQEIALIKGCEHAYCVMCILQWATYSAKPTCPQCKHPFDFLHVHRSLDGSIGDYMFEESVCLLLRATWFKPLAVEEQKYACDDRDDHDEFYPKEYAYEDEDDDLDEIYFSRSSNIHIGNRRWGDNGYVRAGRQAARPLARPNTSDTGAGSSREPKNKEPVNDKAGRRAKRTLKRQAADKVVAAKHLADSVRLGNK